MSLRIGVVTSSRFLTLCSLSRTYKRRWKTPVFAAGDGSATGASMEMSVDLEDVETIDIENQETCLSFRSMDSSEFDLVNVQPEAVEDILEDEDSGNIWTPLWILGLCTISYLHCCSTGFAIPALLPSISADASLNDQQGAFLTVGFTVFFALGQIPFGFLADRMDRMKLLSSGIVVWSLVTSLACKAYSFGDLLLIRLITAAVQSMQNPISFGMIPELFPKNRTTAISLYNCALYFGRALSFVFAILLAKLGVHDIVGIQEIPLEQFDVDSMSLLYVTGNVATVSPLYDYDFQLLLSHTTDASWRDLLFWLGIPGFAIAVLTFLQPDPRKQKMKDIEKSYNIGELWNTTKETVQSSAFQFTTLAASLNDVGFWSLISWQALFYERIYDLPSSTYAPLLAAIIPISGIVGGIGGSLMSDWLAKQNRRYLLTVGGSLLGVPFIFMSFRAEDYQHSFLYLFFGYLFSECWRASGAIMVRESAPNEAASTAAALHLCLRYMVASFGPLCIANLESLIGLQNAMSLVPISYFMSALCFAAAEKRMIEDKSQN
eukprot:g4884.t1